MGCAYFAPDPEKPQMCANKKRDKPETDMPSPTPSPERAIYGFIGLLTSAALAVIYFVFAVVPRQYLEGALGIDSSLLPQRYWATTLPAVLVVLLAAVLVGYVLISFASNNSLSSIHNFIDEHSRTPPSHASGGGGELLTTTTPIGGDNCSTRTAIPTIYDLPLEFVNRKLFDSPSDDQSL